MSNIRKRRVAAIIVFVIFAGVVGWLLQDRPELMASPTERRHFAGELEESRSAPFRTSFPRIAADENQRAVLPDGEWVRLKAVALSVPAADDPPQIPDFLGGSNAPVDLIFRDPASSVALELEIPNPWKSINRAGRNRPQVRLILEFSDALNRTVSENGVWLWDARTHASIVRSWTSSSHGDLAVLDIGIGIWHDTPLILGLLISNRQKNPEGSLDAIYVTIPLAGLLDMPNGRDVENLFDVRIPKVNIETTTFSKSWDIDRQYRELVTEAVELQMELKGQSDSFWSMGKTYVDVTPRELLAEYVRLEKRPLIWINPESDTIEIEYRDTWLEKTRKWWNSWAPVEWPES